MKNKIAILSLSALSLTAPAFNTSAGDHEWATVGKVLTGAALVHAVGHTISHLLPPPPLPLLPPLPPLPGHVHVAGPHLRVIASAPTIPCARLVPAAPVYVAPEPVYYESAPVYVTPSPVRFCPPPVVCVPGPRLVVSPPVIGFGYGYGYGHGYGRGHGYGYRHHSGRW